MIIYWLVISWAAFSVMTPVLSSPSRIDANAVAYQLGHVSIFALPCIFALMKDPESGRYEIHELLRQYGEGKISAASARYEATRDRHSGYYAEFLCGEDGASHAGRIFYQAKLDSGYRVKVEVELDNIRAAWSWMLERKQLPNIAKAIDCLSLIFSHRAGGEGEAIFSAAVDALRALPSALTDEHRRLLGLALRNQGIYAAWQEDSRKAAKLLAEALSLLDGTAHPRDRACALVQAGLCRAQEGDQLQGVAWIKEGVALFRAAECQEGIAYALLWLGSACTWQGDLGNAEGPLREAIAIHEGLELGEPSARLPLCLIRLGGTLARKGRYDEGCRLMSRGFALSEAPGQSWNHLDLNMLAHAQRSLGNYAAAEAHARDCLARSLELRRTELAIWSHCALGEIFRDQQRFGDAKIHLETALRLSQEAERRVLTAIVIQRLGQLAMFRGERAEARTLVSESLAYFAHAGATRNMAEGLDSLGYLACLERDDAAAHDYFQQALKPPLADLAWPLVNHIVAGIGLLAAKTGNPVHAVELLSRVQSDPATERQTHTFRIEPTLAELKEMLPTEEFAAALERGKTLPLEATLQPVKPA